MRFTVRRIRRLTLGGCALALAALACKGKDEEAIAGAAKPVVAASTAKANIEPFTHTVSATGN